MVAVLTLGSALCLQLWLHWPSCMNQIFLPSSFFGSRVLQQCGVADCTQKQLSRLGKVPCLDDQPASKKREREKKRFGRKFRYQRKYSFLWLFFVSLILGNLCSNSHLLRNLIWGSFSKKVVASFGFLCRFFVRISHGGDYSRNFVITL